MLWKPHPTAKIPVAWPFAGSYCLQNQNEPGVNRVMKPHESRSGEAEEPANGNAEKEDLAAEAQQAATMQHFRIPPILLEGDQPPGEPAATAVQQQISDQGL